MTGFIGIDPGNSGGISVLDANGDHVGFQKLDATEHDIAMFLSQRGGTECDEGFAVIEKVGAMPGQGVVSMFTFGKSYGFLRGLLTAFLIPFEEVRPQTWQKVMGLNAKSNLSKKNQTKAAAQRLFPALKITHAMADSLLLATYCLRHSSFKRSN